MSSDADDVLFLSVRNGLSVAYGEFRGSSSAPSDSPCNVRSVSRDKSRNPYASFCRASASRSLCCDSNGYSLCNCLAGLEFPIEALYTAFTNLYTDFLGVCDVRTVAGHGFRDSGGSVHFAPFSGYPSPFRSSYVPAFLAYSCSSGSSLCWFGYG